jgi:hypothetical protein
VARPKKPATPGDMIRSLLVILVPLVIITVLFTNLPRDHPVKEVDWRPVLTTARTEAPYPVLAPVNLPEGWRPTRVNWVKQGNPGLNGQPSPRNYWQLGFLTPDEVYIALSQGDQQVDDMVKDDTRAGVADGESAVNGSTWRRVVSPDGRTRSLVLTQPQVTSVVSSDLPYEALDSYAATLSSSG